MSLRPEATAETETRPPLTWYHKLKEHAYVAAPALLAYVAVRAIGLIVLWIFATRAGVDFWFLMHSRFDSAWYRQIADNGYDAAIPLNPDGTLRTTNLAFFPLYPGLIALVTAVTPWSSAVAGLLVSWLAGIAAAWGIYAVGSHVHTRATGVILAALWGVVPHAVVQNMAYSENLFTALAAWSILAVLRRQWLPAGVLCLLAGLTRPTAIALIAAVGLAALVAVVRRQDSWRPWVAMLLAPLGFLGYLAWVGQRLGRADGYFYMQREAWHVRFDGGANTWHLAVRSLTKPTDLAPMVITLLLLLAMVLLVLSLVDRWPLPVLVYSAVTVFFVLGSAGTFNGKGRYLVPAFTLLLPVATGLAAARTRTKVVIGASLVFASAFFGAYLRLVWKWSP